MRLLLDTHAFLWWMEGDDRLSSRAETLIEEGSNEVFFSSASAWELVVKAMLGRIQFAEPPGVLIPQEVHRNGFQVLPIYLRHALKVFDLPDIHRDPFDRMLVAQAMVEELTVVSGDNLVQSYPVPIEW